MTSRGNLTVAKGVGLGIANGILLGGALATAHRGHYVAVAVAVGMFISLTFVLSCRWAATRR